MKVRNGFITNSSSSSFIITGERDFRLLMEDWKDYIRKEYNEIRANEYWEGFEEEFPTFEDFFERVLSDAEDIFVDKEMKNGGYVVECEDHYENYAETFIHNNFDDWESSNYKIDFYESHH